MKPIPDAADKFTFEEFSEACKEGWFADDDGFGYLGTETEMSDFFVKPSAITGKKFKAPEDVTHVIWFNR